MREDLIVLSYFYYSIYKIDIYYYDDNIGYGNRYKVTHPIYGGLYEQQ